MCRVTNVAVAQALNSGLVCPGGSMLGGSGICVCLDWWVLEVHQLLNSWGAILYSLAGVLNAPCPQTQNKLIMNDLHID